MAIRAVKQKKRQGVVKITSLILLFSILFATFSNNIELFHNHELFPDSCDHHENEFGNTDEYCPYFVWNINSSDQVSAPLITNLLEIFTLYIFTERHETPSLALLPRYSSRAPPILL